MKTMSAVLEPTDLELLALARGGDQASYGRLVSRHQTLVVSLAYSISGDFARSQDIAQEAFVAAWQQLAALDDATKFKAWLCGIARNLGHNFVRQQTRRANQSATSSETTPDTATDAPSPSEHAVSREEASIVWRALEQLPENYREPLILFYREHHSVERVAAALDLSEDTVKQRLSRGRGMLRDQVESLIDRSLGYTTPGVLFTASVLAALPATAMQVAAGTLASAKVGAGMKASWLAVLTTSFLAIPVLNIAVSIFFGRKLLRSCRSPEQRSLFRRLWWIESVVSNGALVVIFAMSAWTSQGGLPLSIEALTLVSLALISLTVIVPTLLFFKYRAPLLAFTRDAQLPENASRRQRKMFFAPRRALIYRSKLSVGGLPLIDIRFGHSKEQPLIRGKAVGWIALGDIAHGVLFACGGLAVGGIAVGGIAIGALSTGWLAAGLVTAGGIAVGGLANGAFVAVGDLALGTGIAIGWDAASGMVAIAQHIADGGIAFAESTRSTQYAVARYWEETNPVVQTFWPSLGLRVVLPGVVNGIAALAGMTAYARHRPALTPATDESGPPGRIGRRVAFLGYFCATVAALAWSFDAAIAHTERRMAADTKAGQEVAEKAQLRYELARLYARSGKPAEALAEFLGCLDANTVRDQPAQNKAVQIYASLVELSRTYPPAKTALLERRNRAEAAVRDARHDSAGIWKVSELVRLNLYLNDQDRMRAFYHELPSSHPLHALLDSQVSSLH
jgi:RNA polymerase sigma factor (sigma-70 family)